MRRFEELWSRFPELLPIQSSIERLFCALLETYHSGGKVLICGNGGSASDSEHICGELLKGFILKRTPSGKLREELNRELGTELAGELQQGIPAVSLPSLVAPCTACANDLPPELAYAQLTLALGKPNDLLLGISTSGNSANVIRAVQVAKALKIRTAVLTGKDGGALAKLADIAVIAPASETFRIQEYHLPIYHAICAQLEEILFN